LLKDSEDSAAVQNGRFDIGGTAAGQQAQRRADGDPIDAAIHGALDRLDARRQRIRDPQTGRWVLGNGGRLSTGHRSDQYWADLEPVRQEIEQRVLRQLALTGDDAPETAIGLAGAYAEARLIRRSEFLQLTRIEDATATPRQRKRINDRRRRHLAAWAMAFDRELKAAMALGLERRERQALTPHEYWEQRQRQQQETS
jgi:hypothetical protein